MATITSIDGIEIFYDVIGEGDISLVFIGGLGARTGRKCWRFQLSLADEYKLVLIDLGGHGKSGKNRERYTMELYGQDIKAVIEKLDLDKVILIGWSLGGATILEAELLLSERVIGLIPVESLFPNSLYTKQDEEVVESVLKPYKEDFVKAYDNLIDSFISEKFDPKDVEDLHSNTPNLDERSMISALAELARWDMYDVLSEIKSPIKSIIAGRSMEHYSKEEFEKNFDVVYIEGLGHLLVFEDPGTFNNVLLEVINELKANEKYSQ